MRKNVPNCWPDVSKQNCSVCHVAECTWSVAASSARRALFEHFNNDLHDHHAHDLHDTGADGHVGSVKLSGDSPSRPSIHSSFQGRPSCPASLEIIRAVGADCASPSTRPLGFPVLCYLFLGAYLHTNIRERQWAAHIPRQQPVAGRITFHRCLRGTDVHVERDASYHCAQSVPQRYVLLHGLHLRWFLTTARPATPTLAASPAAVFNAAVKQSATLRALAIYVLCASCFTLSQLIMSNIYEPADSRDTPRLSPFGKSKSAIYPSICTPSDVTSGSTHIISTRALYTS